MLPTEAQAKRRGCSRSVSIAREVSESDMAQSPENYLALRNYRAGIEAVISWGKRSFGLARCIWKGWESFCSYVLSGVVARNLVIMARHRLRC